VLEAPPPIVSVLGNPSLLAREMVAIVGARNASALGRKLATTLAQDLSASGLVVASGMARGIDAAARRGVGRGHLRGGGGRHRLQLSARKQGGSTSGCAKAVIVSEMPVGLVPRARHIPRRNRIISGLARGVIVVEAAEVSGSLIMANYALEQSRDVFAIPGSPLDPRAKGANRLIRAGATLTETAGDVLAVLRPIISQDFREPEGPTFEFCGVSLGDAEAGRLRAILEEAFRACAGRS
jgi:DNA processing protein